MTPFLSSSPRCFTEKSFLGLAPSVRKGLTGMPFFLVGQSMGGALALLAALRLKGDKTMSDISERFLGLMTNCPAIVGEHGCFRQFSLVPPSSLTTPRSMYSWCFLQHRRSIWPCVFFLAKHDSPTRAIAFCLVDAVRAAFTSRLGKSNVLTICY